MEQEKINKNFHTLLYALCGLIVVAALIFGYRFLVAEPRAEKAAEMMIQPQVDFEMERFDVATEGFLKVIDQYGATPSGNLAKHYAGICYLRLGDLENAALYLGKFKAVKGVPGEIINAQNHGLRGDVAVDQEDLDYALTCFEKAITASDNELTTPLYLQKAALVAHAKGDVTRALAFAQRITDEFSGSAQARDAERLIGSIVK